MPGYLSMFQALTEPLSLHWEICDYLARKKTILLSAQKDGLKNRQ
jgi:hypothetical protein